MLFCDVQTLRVPVPVIACGLPRVPERSAALYCRGLAQAWIRWALEICPRYLGSIRSRAAFLVLRAQDENSRAQAWTQLRPTYR